MADRPPEDAGTPQNADAPQDADSTEDAEARRLRADRATRGALAAILCLEAFVVLLVPRTIAQTSQGLNGTKTGLLIGLAVVLVVIAAMLRRPWGIAAGSAVQLAVVATGYLVPLLLIVVVCFLALWGYLLRLRHQLLGTPSGWRVLIS
jgi:Protein of unknown function (DUF4233)